MTVRGPRRLVHRGVVDARGAVVSVGGDEARRRVVSLWTPGTRVSAVGEALLVRWPVGRRMDCAHAPGVVLVALRGALVAAPWSPAELDGLGAIEGCCVLLAGDRAAVLRPDEGAAVDPSDWIDLEGYEVASPATLGEPPEALAVLDARGVREVLTGARTVARPEWREIAAALGARLDAPLSSREGESSQEPETVRDAPPTWLTRALGAVRAWFAAGRSAEASKGVIVRAARGVGASWLDALGRWLDASAKSLQVNKGLHALLGARNAAFLEGLISRLEGGDVEGALYEAIPLGGSRDDGEGEIAWSLPAPRQWLTITVGATGARSVMPIGETLQERLRKIYRATAERLAADGKIDQAVFVLAELLGDPSGAVDLLVRHQKYVMAAEIAEAAALEPSLVARIYMLARMPDEALRVVRLARCFDACLKGLASEPVLRTELNARWARHLAAVGEPLDAAVLARSDATLRGEARGWLKDLARADHPRRIEALGALLTRYPETWDDIAMIATSVIERVGRAGAEDRLGLSRVLVSQARCEEVCALGRALIPALVRDGGETVSVELSQRTDALVTYVADRAVRADLPTRAVLPVVAPSASVRVIAAHDAGARRVFDVGCLPDGRVLAAMGEAGIAVFDRDGARRPSLAVTAHALVVPTRGARVIALARRADVVCATRIDMEDGSHCALGELALESWAPEHDGDAWVIAQGGRLVAIDVLASEITALRASRRVKGRVLGVVVRGAQCAAVVQGKRALELMGCAAPGLTGLRRRPMPAAAEGGRWAVTATQRIVAANVTSGGARPALVIDRDGRETSFEVTGAVGAVRGLSTEESLTAVLTHDGDHLTARLLDVSKVGATPDRPGGLASPWWGVSLGGASEGGVRLGQHTLTVWDELGRVLCYRLASRALRLDARV